MSNSDSRLTPVVPRMLPRTSESVERAVQRVIDALAAGGMVVVGDDANPTRESDLVMSATATTDEKLAFFLRHGSGLISVPMPAPRADALDLLPMVARSTDRHDTAYTVSVDHCGTTSGVSAADRAATIRALAEPTTYPEHLRRPGHVFPVRTHPGGVLAHRDYMEAAVDLVRLARCGHVGVITELLGEDGVPLSAGDARQFAAHHRIPMLNLTDLVKYRRGTERLIYGSGNTSLPTRFGTFTATAYRSLLGKSEHLALTCGDLASADVGHGGVLTRVHIECVTGDALGSRRCNCGLQLADALTRIAHEGAGALIYLRRDQSDGPGSQLRTYPQRHNGADDTGTPVGGPRDHPDYEVAAAILADLGIQRLRLIVDNPQTCHSLETFGLEIAERVPGPTALKSQTTDHLIAGKVGESCAAASPRADACRSSTGHKRTEITPVAR